MENNPKKSKAFIITFILILLLLIAGYYFFKNREQIFGTKGSLSVSKIFAPLLGTSKSKDVAVIDTTKTTTDTGTVTKKKVGIIIVDVNGNKIVRAEAGENLKKGDVLYISGFNKMNDPIVMKAIANDKNKSLVFGVAGEDMNQGSMLDVIIEGVLSGVPTNRKEGTLWAPKNILYLSDVTYGGMTKNPPVSSSSFIVPVGSVLTINAINGSIHIGNLTTATTMNPDQKSIITNLNSNLLSILNNKDNNKNLSVEQKNGIKNLSKELVNILNLNKSLTSGQMNNINNLYSQLLSNTSSGNKNISAEIMSNINNLYGELSLSASYGTLSTAEMGNFNNLISSILSGASSDMNDYWGSIFGPTNTNINGPSVNNTPNGPGVPILNPINIPTNGPSFNNPNTGNNVNTGNNPNTGNNTTNTDNTTNTNNPTDTNNPATDTNLNTNTTVDACLAIEQNPLTFTEEEKAQLAVLLRKFYLVSSTLKTSEDITTIYSEIDQQKNFISQIEDLTSQCYSQATDAVMFANNWKRHGNPWYAKTTGGNFPYTSDNTGYLDYSQIDGGMTPAGYKVISGYYYGTLSRDTNGGKTGDSCDKFNNFPGYGLSDQINNKKEIYMSHYCGSTGGFLGLFSGSSCYANGNGAGYPGDSLLSNSSSLTNRQPQKTLLESGCKWKDGVILDNTERLLNIW